MFIFAPLLTIKKYRIMNKTISAKQIKVISSLFEQVLEKTKRENSIEFLLNEVLSKRRCFSIYGRSFFDINIIDCLKVEDLYNLRKLLDKETLNLLESRIQTVHLVGGNNISIINFYHFIEIFKIKLS